MRIDPNVKAKIGVKSEVTVKGGRKDYGTGIVLYADGTDRWMVKFPKRHLTASVLATDLILYNQEEEKKVLEPHAWGCFVA